MEGTSSSTTTEMLSTPAESMSTPEGKDAARPAGCCGTQARPLVRIHPLAVFVIAAVAYFPLGLIFGIHWWVLFICKARTRAEKLACMLHFSVYIVMLLVTGAGGWYVRFSGTYNSCGNTSMTRDCLWDDQPQTYQIVYVMHFTSGGMLLTHWVLDGVQLPGWTLLRRPLATLYSPYALFPAYTLLLPIILVFTTLAWTVWADWDANRLAPLLGVLLLVILSAGAVAALGLQCLGRMCTPPRACAPHPAPLGPV